MLKQKNLRTFSNFLTMFERIYIFKISYGVSTNSYALLCIEKKDPGLVESLRNGVCPFCGRKMSQRGLASHLRRREQHYVPYMRKLYFSCYGDREN